MSRESNHALWSSIRTRVRAVVSALTGSEFDPAAVMRSLKDLQREATGYDHALCRALAEVLRDGEPRERCVAAGLLHFGNDGSGKVVSVEGAHDARQVLVASLESDEAVLFATACAVLMAGTVPTECVPRLFEVMHGGSETCRVAAAGALSRVDPDEMHAIASKLGPAHYRGITYELSLSDVVQVLHASARTSECEGARGLAAIQLLRLLPKLKSAEVQVVDLLQNSPPELQFSLLEGIDGSRAQSPVLLAAVRELVNNVSCSAAVRGRAAELLGALTIGTRDAMDILHSALLSTDPLIVRGAMLGLRLTSADPGFASDRYVELLTSEREELRIVAMNGLANLDSVPSEAVAALVQRLGVEATRDAWKALLAALKRAGVAAVKPLIASLDSATLPQRHFVALALGEIGLEGARGMLQSTREDPREETLEVLVGVFAALGRDAEPLVPDLVDAVETSTEGEVTAFYMVCVCFTQSTSMPAVRVLVEALLYAPIEVADYAERALRGMGAVVVPVVETVLRDDRGGDRARVARFLRECMPGLQASGASSLTSTPRVLGQDSRFRRFVEFDDDRRLITFLYVGREWKRLGPTSIRTIAAELETRRQGGKLAPGHALRRRTIYDHVRAVQDWCGESLVTQTEGRAGGLTVAGESFLLELEEYFEAKFGRRVD